MAAVELQDTPSARPALAPAPVRVADRIQSLDVLRGFAVLGILAVNAISFAWPVAVISSGHGLPPETTAWNDQVGAWVTQTFFTDKFRNLFTLLFGASIFLVGGERFNEAKGPVLTRRLLWLGLFGLIHGLAFWYGDILLHYAYCGLLVMLMRSWSAKRLIWVGASISLVWGLMATTMYWFMAAAPPEVQAQMQQGQPVMDAASVAAVVEIYNSGLIGVLTENAKAWMLLQLAVSPMLILVSVPLMLLGMGLFKSGFLAGRSPAWVYLLVGLPGALNLAALAWFGWQDLDAGDDMASNGLGEAARGMAPLITLFYASALILLLKVGLKPLGALLAPVGRMAFTNYLAQTLIMATLYYAPWGPQWFGQHHPAQMWMVVGAVWLVQIIWSPLWLSRFTMGPLEWVWRCLSYRQAVPLIRRAEG